VNISSISLLGGVVLFGFEDKPTAQDRKDRLKKEESMIYLINNVLKKFFEKDLLDLNGCPDKYSNDCTELLGLMKDVMRLLNLRISTPPNNDIDEMFTFLPSKQSLKLFNPSLSENISSICGSKPGFMSSLRKVKLLCAYIQKISHGFFSGHEPK
jgi:hypothetical protein